MSRDGADGAPPMRKRVRAARLTLAHASGLRYAQSVRRGPPLSRPVRASAFGHPRPVNGTSARPPKQNVERAEAFVARDTGRGPPPTRIGLCPVGTPRTHRRVASRSARLQELRPGRATESALAKGVRSDIDFDRLAEKETLGF